MLHTGKCNCERYIFTCEKDHLPKFENQKLRILHNIGPRKDTLRRSTFTFIQVKTISHQSLYTRFEYWQYKTLIEIKFSPQADQIPVQNEHNIPEELFEVQCLPEQISVRHLQVCNLNEKLPGWLTNSHIESAERKQLVDKFGLIYG